jgi:uncharacterized protein
VAPTTGTTPTEDWTVRAFARWKVGRKGLDDGLVVFVFPTDRKVRIEVGYGLEQTVPDATAARIIRDTITPKIRAGQPDDAVVAGVDAILAAIGGEANGNGGKAGPSSASGAAPPRRATPAPYEPSPDGDPGQTWGQIFGIVIGILIALGIIVTIMKLPTRKGSYISSRSSSGGWGIAGDILGLVSAGVSVGGFSGGGGMSGGGGATGSW